MWMSLITLTMSAKRCSSIKLWCEIPYCWYESPTQCKLSCITPLMLPVYRMEGSPHLWNWLCFHVIHNFFWHGSFSPGILFLFFFFHPFFPSLTLNYVQTDNAACKKTLSSLLSVDTGVQTCPQNPNQAKTLTASRLCLSTSHTGFLYYWFEVWTQVCLRQK